MPPASRSPISPPGRGALRKNGKTWTEKDSSNFPSFPPAGEGFSSPNGDSLFTKFDAKPEVIGFPLGTLDTDPGVKATRHIFVGSKAPWFDITDTLPQHDKY